MIPHEFILLLFWLLGLLLCLRHRSSPFFDRLCVELHATMELHSESSCLGMDWIDDTLTYPIFKAALRPALV